MKLPFFTMPYPNEILNHTISRYIKITDEPYSKTVKQLFDSQSNSFNLMFYKNYQNLSELTGLSPKIILEFYTPYLFISPFQTVEEKERIYSIIEGKGKNFNLSGTSLFKYNKHLRYCPICAKEETEYLSEPYISIYHCLPNVPFCIYHKNILEQAKNEDDLYGTTFLLNETNVEKLPVYNEKASKIIGKLQNMFLEIFEKNGFIINHSIEEIPEKIYTMLQKNGYTHEISKRIKTKELVGKLFEFYNLDDPEVMDLMDLKNEDFQNIGLMISKNNQLRPLPIVYYLLIGMFCASMSDFYDIKPHTLEKMSGKNMKGRGKSNLEKKSVITKNRDDEIRAEIQRTVDRIIKIEDHPRVTKNRILDNLGNNIRIRDVSLYPNSKKLIAELTEDIDEYRFQRIRRGAKELIANERKVTMTNIRRIQNIEYTNEVFAKYWEAIINEFREYVPKRSRPR